MIPTTFNSATVWLCDHAPAWTRPVRLRVTLPVTVERGETSPEARGALDLALRGALRWSAVLNQAALASLENAGKAMGDQQVVVPVWPLAVAGGDWAAAEVKGGLVVAWMRGWTDWELSTTGPATPGDWDYVAPALLGYFTKVPEVDLLRGTAGALEFEFEEDATSDYALTPPTRTWTNGPALNDATVPQRFPLRINWAEPPRLSPSSVEIERRGTDAGRQTATAYFPQPGDRAKRGNVTLEGTDVATLLAWWRDRRGSVEPHLVAGEAEVTALTANALAGTTSLTVADATLLGEHRWLRLSNGLREEWVRVASLAGNVLTLTAALTQSWSVAGTRIELVLLARHARSELELTFTSPRIATAAVAWREVSAELAPGAGETRGETLGALANRAWLYLFTEDYGGGVTTEHRCTSHGRDIEADAETWTTRPGLSHGEIRQTLRLDRDEVTVEGRWWTGCPLGHFLPGRLAALVRLAIYECTVDAAGNGTDLEQKFGGEIARCPFDGPFFKAQASGFYSMFDRPAFALRLQRGCNATVFTPLCGLDVADWTVTGETVSVSGTSLTLNNWSGPGLGSGFSSGFSSGFG